MGSNPTLTAKFFPFNNLPRKIQMLLEANVIGGAYVQDILEQPEALRRTLAGLIVTAELERVASGRYQRIMLTGMGSSLSALYPLYLHLTGKNYHAFMVETAELIHYQESMLDEHTLVIAASQSGESAEIIRLLALARGRCKLIGVCNSPHSRLVKSADALIPLQAGAESAVSCKTYIATLLALHWLGAVLTRESLAAVRDELAEAAPSVSRYLVR